MPQGPYIFQKPLMSLAGRTLVHHPNYSEGNPYPTRQTRWYLNGTAILGATGDTYVPTDEGIYESADVWSGAEGTIENRSLYGIGIGASASDPALPIAALIDVAAFGTTEWLTSIGKEQSLGLGANLGQSTGADGVSPARIWANSLNNGQARVLTGLQRSDGVAMSQISGPLLTGYNLSMNATGDAAYTNNTIGNCPVQYLIMCELLRRGFFTNTFVTLFSNAGGQSINQMDDNVPSVTGSTSTVLLQNLDFGSRQIATRAAANGRQARVLFDLLMQGEADANMERNAWRSQYHETDRDQRARLSANGYQTDLQTIPRLVFQTGGYVESLTKPHHVCLDQIDLVREGNAIFAGPLHQFLVADNNVHPDLREYCRAATLGAWAFMENFEGRPFNLLSHSHRIVGEKVLVTYPMRPGETLHSINSKFNAYGGNPHGGYEVTGGASIIEAVPSTTQPGLMEVTLDRPASGLGQLKLGRQMVDRRSNAVGNFNYGSQRVGWAGTETSESLIWPGDIAERVLPSEEWAI